jgi:hypothetical protein
LSTETNTVVTSTLAGAPATVLNVVFRVGSKAANAVGDLGLVDLNTGVVTPVVTGFKGVHGLAFSPKAVAVAPASDGQ